MLTKQIKIVICATDDGDLSRVTDAVVEAGDWGIVSVRWPDAKALAKARADANVFIVHATEPCDELVELLTARERAALIVIGPVQFEQAQPTLWMPDLPAPALLASVIAHVAPDAPPTIRRKSDMIIGTSKAVQSLLHALDQLAPAHTPVLITGESGVGKELVARALHFCGPRTREPFIAVSCTTPALETELFGNERHEGAIDAVGKGTLFLDEIGVLPLTLQAKLLRVLETSSVKFRLVSATQRNLEDDVKQSRFREDLFYRVQVYPLAIPPLRERKDDVVPIATHHLSVIATREQRTQLKLTREALDKLVGYWWPGNVRELVNVLERAALLAGDGEVIADHIVLPKATRNSLADAADAALGSYRDAKVKFEYAYYTQLLASAGGNITRAAKLAQKTRKEIYDALRRLGIDNVRGG